MEGGDGRMMGWMSGGENVPSQSLGLFGNLELNPLSLCVEEGLSVIGRNTRSSGAGGN